MNEVLKRSLTGLVFIALVLGSLWVHIAATIIIFGLATVLGTIEYYRMTASDRNDTNANVDRLKGIARVAVGAIFLCAVHVPPHIVAAFSLLGVIMSFNYLRIAPSKANWFEALFPVFYFCLPFALIPSIVFYSPSTEGRWLVTAFFLLLWTNDTMAYVVGRLLGKNKLYPRLSPKKTIEGFIGGAVFSALIGMGLHAWTGLLSMADWAVLAVIVAVFGSLGDLIESGIKRFTGVKDSGTILPGHGGILDRFDGLFLSLPLFFGYIYFTQLH